MLKIFKNKVNIKKTNIINNKIQKDNVLVATAKHYIPANKEWFNSVYTFNKNSIKLLPVADNQVINLIRSYFNMYSRFLEDKNKAPRIPAWKRVLSERNFWISKPELKHTNNNIIIDLYIYNRQKQFFLKK